mgnify:CR=1 FL=1|jgi:hypothetical protein
MNHGIYLVMLFVVTIIIVIYYYFQEKNHRQELEKIEKMERNDVQRKQEMKVIRAKSTPCNVGNYSDPRSCYFDSGYQCKWNEIGNRCDKKK